MPTTETDLVHVTPDDVHVIGPDDFGAAGLWARESVGPFAEVEALGMLVTVHDSRFDPHSGIGHHPHRGMERLFYILEGSVDHDDALNNIQGHMGTGDLGILTEGRRGMLHSEWNNGDEAARAYILVYPTDPTPPTADFAAIRAAETTTVRPAEGVTTKVVVDGGDERLHGDLRRFTDSRLQPGATCTFDLAPDEAALTFAVEGVVHLHDAHVELHDGHTLLAPPNGQPRRLTLVARDHSRVLHAVTGPGDGRPTDRPRGRGG
ncbi:MAG: pirin family protein [Actinobacteria bacterium]|nr:pirin family protein [Actinomycetota bacterium]